MTASAPWTQRYGHSFLDIDSFVGGGVVLYVMGGTTGVVRVIVFCFIVLNFIRRPTMKFGSQMMEV